MADQILPDYDDPITTSDPDKILDHTRLLMLEAGLDLDTWSASIFGGERMLGKASANLMGPTITDGSIEISRLWFVDLGVDALLRHSDDVDPSILENTIRHEIAHALDYKKPPHGKSSGHGYAWQDLAVKCGARPETCEDGAPTRLAARWKRHCPECGMVYKYLYRYSERKHSYLCSECADSRRDTDYKLEVVENEDCLVT